ncbi:MAG TPA: PAS domain S-box protein [Acidimicrobiales bacterium]|nr:PAS domain S-box protein [Acidimicrobiales bacterium]
MCRLAIDSAADAFVALDADGHIVEWNSQAERLFGFRREDVVGGTINVNPFQPGPGGTDLAWLAKDAAPGASKRMMTRVVAPDGSVVPVELTLWSSGGGAGTGRTCNAFFRVLDRPTTNELVCSVGAIVESSDAAIISQGLDGRILTWNEAAEHVYGYLAEEVIGQSATILAPRERHAEVQSGWEAAARGEPVASHETARRRKDGSLVDVAVTVSPVRDPVGRVVGISTIARDITEQRRLAVALERALEEAREAEARSQRFLADAAHQMRTPVAGIRACADSLLRSTSTGGRERLLAHLIDEANRTSRLVNDLLRVARLDQGEDPRLGMTDLLAVCQHEAERVRIQAPELEVTVRSSHHFPQLLHLDEGAIREIVSNLLDNARRYARTRIEVAADQSDADVQIKVVDDGPGLPEELAEVAFERFATLDPKGGSGLGLPIARALSRAHGGDLVYESGAFVLRLPLTLAGGTGNGK